MSAIHPGDVLLKIMLDRDWSLSSMAHAVRVDREILIDLLERVDSVTPEVAAQLEVGTGVSAPSWLNWQQAYDAEEAGHPLPIHIMSRAEVEADIAVPEEQPTV